MNYKTLRKKGTIQKLAAFMALNILVESVSPAVALALTGGPSQPEVESFEPVGTTQMVDLFTGDFNYNIPLLDVGGYPINMAYHAGIGMEQEASWVGLGWNLNPGNVSRGMRGIPDDFMHDEIETEFNILENKTWGVSLGADLSVFGMSRKKLEELQQNTKSAIEENNERYQDAESGIISDKQAAINDRPEEAENISNEYKKLLDGIKKELESDNLAHIEGLNNATDKIKSLGSFRVTLGITKNNYRGVGLSFNLTKSVSGKSGAGGSIGLGVNSQTGSDISFNASFQKSEDGKEKGYAGIGLNYNSLFGLRQLSVSGGYHRKNEKKERRGANMSIPISMRTYFPSSQMDMRSMAYSLDLTIGGEAIGTHGNIYTQAQFSEEALAQKSRKNPAFGYFHHHVVKGSGEYRDALLDFNRTADQTYNKFVTQLPQSFSTFDIFSVSGQGTGGMYRAHHNNIPVYYNSNVNTSTGLSVAENFGFGLGAAVHVKGGKKVTHISGRSGAWDGTENPIISNIDATPSDPAFERYYLKMGGELTPGSETEYNNWNSESPKHINLGKTSRTDRNRKFAKVDESNLEGIKYHATERQARANTITFLTAKEASKKGIGLETTINSYPEDFYDIAKTNGLAGKYTYSRVDAYKKEHHISEVTQYSPDGTRYVYGIPAYNKTQKEVVFNTSGTDANESIAKGLVAYTPGVDNTTSNQRGINHFFSSKTLPGYAHSYLLTAVLSPDYVDVLGDGITDDDLGTAVRINYRRQSDNYQWRAPYEQDSARLDIGRYADPMDSKGSYIYGQKEIWYVHSIVSKTHVALFRTSDRLDGHGVAGENGGISTSDDNTLRKLDQIELYSKLDFFTSSNPTPIKKVVFEYDYSLCQGIPNNENVGDNEAPSTSKGKLTLKKVWFTYGHSQKGSLSPYQFSYGDVEDDKDNPDYDLTKMDRWGNYKEHDPDMPNRDFPYTDQSSATDDYASVWCLKEIKLPSGGKINVEYESDDYAYVQDRKAMEMVKITGAGSSVNQDPELAGYRLYEKSTNYNVLFFKIDPTEIQNDNDLYEKMLHGYAPNPNDEKIRQLYYRFRVNMSPENFNQKYFEYISGYSNFVEAGVSSKNPNYGYIKLDNDRQRDKKGKEINPISKAAWQIGLQELRPIIYPGSSPEHYGKSAMLGLINALPTVLNIFTGPYQNLKWKKIAQVFSPNESYIRLYSPKMAKKGGGVRVKRILLNDDWANMNSGQNSTEYGQKFEYTTFDENLGRTHSSGVASYEPMIGNDENPWRRPEFRTERIPLGPNQNIYSDIPVGESLMPGASVGYSEVKVTSIANAKSPRSSTGYTKNKFYTARDFPVQTGVGEMQRLDNSKEAGQILQQIFAIKKRQYQAASQGYVIQLNNMHGKPKSVEVFGENETGNVGRIGGSEYKYQTKGSRSEMLDNTVKVLNESGVVEEMEIGREYDVAIDMRQNWNRQRTFGVNIGGDVTLPFFPFPVPWIWPEFRDNETLYQTAVTTKVIQKYGVLKEVIAYDYGSQVSTKNELWDKQTGQVLLTSTKNEYEDDIYNFTFPAHLAYEGMGLAYKNIGYHQDAIWFDSAGYGNLDTGNNHFVKGDELLMSWNSGADMIRGWVLESSGNQIRVIDNNGDPIGGTYGVKVIRSGRRNMFSNAVGSFVGMKNPIQGVEQPLNLEDEIIQTSAITYSDEWQGYWDRYYAGGEVCDTTEAVEQVFDLIQAIYDDPNTSEKMLYDYANDPNADPLVLLGNGWFDSSDLHKALIKKARDNSIDNDSLSFYFGFLSDGNGGIGSNSFDFQIKYPTYTSGNFDSFTFLNVCQFQFDWWSNNYPYPDLDSIDQILIPVFYELPNVYPIGRCVSVSGDTFEFYIPGLCIANEVVCTPQLFCNYILGQSFNPYTNGVRGIWRPKQTYAFNGERKYVHAGDSTRIRKDGIIKDYITFWDFSNPSIPKLSYQNMDTTKWVAASTATLYSPEGNGLEEKNALGIYSAQIYGYDNTLVTAVGSNARHRQLAFDNFEDYNYVVNGCDKQFHFDFREGLNYDWVKRYAGGYVNGHVRSYAVYNDEAYIRKDTAHSGYYSLALQPGKSHSNTRLIDLSSVDIDNSGDTTLFRLTNADECVGLFAPDTAKKYVISAWVHQDGNVNDYNTFSDAKIQVQIYNNGNTSFDSTYQASGLIIDGWQRLEGAFTVEEGADSIKVTLVNTGSNIAGFDDIRIHPYHGNMKSYVYHNVLLRVIAELDENNYATFYEYDAEGTLIRVKKETEKGIVTIQENRKSVRKQ